MTPETLDFEPTLTAFMLVKTAPEWLALPIDRRFELLGEYITPLLRKYADSARLRFYDVEFYAAHVTDIWLWDARDHQAYQLLVEELRETPFWDRYFAIVDILVGVENAYARNYGRVPVTALS